MKLYDKLLKPITEVNNLKAEKVDCCRIIIRYFYQKHEKTHYQLSEYSVVIERMTKELEHLAVGGASLEPTLLERIRTQILQLLAVRDKYNIEVADWRRSLNDDFIRLNQNYLDYIKTLNNAKAEQMMKSREFLVFKDKLITYLQKFVKRQQEHGLIIEDYLSGVKDEDMALIFDKVAEYEISIPRINSHITKAAVLEN